MSPVTAKPVQKGASLTRNVSVNWLLMATGIVYSLAVTPFVIHTLGTEGYGVWSFVNGLTTYVDLFYLGLGSALVRFVAEFRARNDLPRMRRLCSVVFTVYVAIGGLFLLGAVIVSPVVPRLLGSNLQSISAGVASVTVILIGARLSALFAGSVFSGILFAYDRNDIFKGVLIAFTCIRLLLVVLCVGGDYAIVILAAVFTVTSWAEALVLAVFARRVTGGLSIGPVIPRLSDLRPLYAFGLMSFGIQLSAKLISYTDTTVIGMKIGATDVALYVLPLQLIEYGRYAIAAIASVILPRLVLMHAEGQSKEMGWAFVRVARVTCFLGAWLNVNLILLGRPFLGRWVGSGFATDQSQWVLLWLGLASFCQVLSTQVTLPFYQTIQVLGRPMLVLLLEAVVNLAGSLWLIRRFGLSGVAFATFMPSFFLTLWILPVHLCRRLELPVGRTFTDVLRPSLVVSVITGAVLMGLNQAIPTASYGVLAFKGIASLLAGSIAFMVSAPEGDREQVREAIRQAARAIRAGSPTPAISAPEYATLIQMLVGPFSAPPVVLRWTQLLGSRERRYALHRLQPEARVMVPLSIGGRTPVARLAGLMGTLAQIRFVEWQLKRSSLSLEGRFAAFPDLHKPVILYALDSDAAKYATRFLLPAPASGLKGPVRSGLERWTGLPAALGGVVVVARRA
jgi:O-antigen/teichoic acid export membrane protein